jgi:hypothetical protein
MICYRDFSPTGFDVKGLGAPDHQDWLVVIGVNRDSSALARSNFRVACDDIRKGARYDTGDDFPDYEILHLGHWACGWIKVLIVRPGTPCAEAAERIAERLEGYPVLSDDDFTQEEQREADETWACYSTAERIEIIRAYRKGFEFHDFKDMLGCVRGKYYAGLTERMVQS